MLLFLCVLLLPDKSLGAIVCPGTYSGHLQGITTGKKNTIYWSFTKVLVKTDAEGKLLKKTLVPNHHGDLTFYDEKVYVAVNLGKFNKEAEHAQSWIYVYDSKNLKLVSKHSIPEVVHGAGGIDYYKKHFFVVGGLPKGHKENYVYEYDKNFKFLKKHTINGYTLKGIQTACYFKGHWWFGCYGETPTLLKTDGSFRFLEKYDFDCALGISKFSEDILLIGRRLGSKNRQGQALSAKIDCDKGFVIIETKIEKAVPPSSALYSK